MAVSYRLTNSWINTHQLSWTSWTVQTRFEELRTAEITELIQTLGGSLQSVQPFCLRVALQGETQPQRLPQEGIQTAEVVLLQSRESSPQLKPRLLRQLFLSNEVKRMIFL